MKSWYIPDLKSVMMIISVPTKRRPLDGTSNEISIAGYECLTSQATYIHFIYNKDFSVFTCAFRASIYQIWTLYFPPQLLTDIMHFKFKFSTAEPSY